MAAGSTAGLVRWLRSFRQCWGQSVGSVVPVQSMGRGQTQIPLLSTRGGQIHPLAQSPGGHMGSGDPSLTGTWGQGIHPSAKPPFPKALCAPGHAAWDMGTTRAWPGRGSDPRALSTPGTIGSPHHQYVPGNGTSPPAGGTTKAAAVGSETLAFLVTLAVPSPWGPCSDRRRGAEISLGLMEEGPGPRRAGVVVGHGA